MSGWRKRTIMEMARVAGLIKTIDCCGVPDKFCGQDQWKGDLRAFAKLVREDALAQPAPVQEPVAHRDGYWCVDLTCKKCYSADFRFKHTTPPAQPAPVQEPVGWIDSKGNMICTKINESCRPLYTTPPQRTWVGLSDEELDHIWNVIGNSDAHGDVDGWSGRDVMTAIEAKLKEKNNG